MEARHPKMKWRSSLVGMSKCEATPRSLKMCMAQKLSSCSTADGHVVHSTLSLALDVVVKREGAAAQQHSVIVMRACSHLLGAGGVVKRPAPCRVREVLDLLAGHVAVDRAQDVRVREQRAARVQVLAAPRVHGGRGHLPCVPEFDREASRHVLAALCGRQGRWQVSTHTSDAIMLHAACAVPAALGKLRRGLGPGEDGYPSGHEHTHNVMHTEKTRKARTCSAAV